MKPIYLLPLLLLLTQSCDLFFRDYKQKYSKGEFPDTPVNFEDINTEYDDYNATAPFFGENFPLCFSSSRNSKGTDFDIIYKKIYTYFDKTTGELSVTVSPKSYNYERYDDSKLKIINALPIVNSSSNEFGPYLIWQRRKNEKGSNLFHGYIFLFSSDKEGSQDIYFTENLEDKDGNYSPAKKVAFLNSDFDDAYPTFDEEFSELYFTSNRESSFNIYCVKTDKTKSVVEILSDTTLLDVEKVTALSSDYDDKCPFIVGDYLVFASNRPGGYGGYDLYYSKRVDGEWTSPVNFGEKINTNYDEFRPIVKPHHEFKNDFMLFSSNRPGGKGGFDLYYVGITW